MSSSLEDFALDNIRRRVPGIERSGFTARYSLREYGIRPGFRPDAFFSVIDRPDQQAVVMYEVEDTSKLTKKKLFKIKEWHMKYSKVISLSFLLISLDRYGIDEKVVLEIQDVTSWINYPSLYSREEKAWVELKEGRYGRP